MVKQEGCHYGLILFRSRVDHSTDSMYVTLGCLAKVLSALASRGVELAQMNIDPLLLQGKSGSLIWQDREPVTLGKYDGPADKWVPRFDAVAAPGVAWASLRFDETTVVSTILGTTK